MRSIQVNKKGMSLGDLYPAVLVVVLIGIMLGIGLYILSTLHSSIANDYDGSQNLINCSTATTLTNASLTEFYLVSVDTVTNQTGTAITDYTSSTAGVITWGTTATANCTADGFMVNMTFTYNYDATDTPEEAVTTTIAGVADFADWIAIIVVVIAAAIVLGVVLSSFGRRKNSI